jgi:hypothetical protein
MWRLYIFVPSILHLMVITGVAAPEEVVELRLTASFAMAPASVGGVIRVPRNDDNRLLRVVADSDHYYRSSDINLEGGNAPLNHTVWFKEMPAGRYNIEVTVFGAHGPRGVRMERLEVMGAPRVR